MVIHIQRWTTRSRGLGRYKWRFQQLRLGDGNLRWYLHLALQGSDEDRPAEDNEED